MIFLKNDLPEKIKDSIYLTDKPKDIGLTLDNIYSSNAGYFNKMNDDELLDIADSMMHHIYINTNRPYDSRLYPGDIDIIYKTFNNIKSKINSKCFTVDNFLNDNQFKLSFYFYIVSRIWNTTTISNKFRSEKIENNRGIFISNIYYSMGKISSNLNLISKYIILLRKELDFPEIKQFEEYLLDNKYRKNSDAIGDSTEKLFGYENTEDLIENEYSDYSSLFFECLFLKYHHDDILKYMKAYYSRINR